MVRYDEEFIDLRTHALVLEAEDVDKYQVPSGCCASLATQTAPTAGEDNRRSNGARTAAG